MAKRKNFRLGDTVRLTKLHYSAPRSLRAHKNAVGVVTNISMGDPIQITIEGDLISHIFYCFPDEIEKCSQDWWDVWMVED